MFALVMLSLQPCSVVVYLLFNVLPIVCGSSVFVFVLLCITCVHSSFAIILKRKRKLVALLLLSCRCIVIINVLWLFLTVPWVGLQYVTVVFFDHIHFLFCTHLLGKGLTSWLSCVLCFITFPYSVLCQVWYQIASIPYLWLKRIYLHLVRYTYKYTHVTEC